MVETGLAVSSAHLVHGQDWSGSFFLSFNSWSRLVWQFILLIQFMVSAIFKNKSSASWVSVSFKMHLTNKNKNKNS